ncbi:hypothetical protein PBI_SCTP2_172 [Salicola phage SCTP-2]|nr:hypothetical protein PBI_SCTP2_172 [Salicola phage SCTP-2]
MSKNDQTATHPELTPSDMLDELRFNIHEAPSQGLVLPPIMMWGQPGVGKSDLARQIGRELKRIVIDIRLLLKDPTDLSGIPYFNPDSKRMETGAPSELPPSMSELDYLRSHLDEVGQPEMIEPSATEPTDRQLATIMDKLERMDNGENVDFTDVEKSKLMYMVNAGNAVIFLDEISSAPPAVQAAALQLVLDRKVGEYKLPESVSLIAAGNRSEDNSVNFSMPTPLRNRFSHFTLVPHYESWEQWAIDNHIHHLVVGYLKAHSGNLNTFNPKNRHEYAFATPRSWEFVSNVLKALTDEKGNVKQEHYKRLQNQVYSMVGVGVGSEFMASFELLGQLPDPMDILEGRVKTHDLESLKASANYALIVNLCHRMHEKEQTLRSKQKDGNSTGELHDTMNKYGDNYLNFLMENLDFQEDFIIMGASIALKQYNLKIGECDAMDELVDRYDNILTEL